MLDMAATATCVALVSPVSFMGCWCPKDSGFAFKKVGSGDCRILNRNVFFLRQEAPEFVKQGVKFEVARVAAIDSSLRQVRSSHKINNIYRLTKHSLLLTKLTNLFSGWEMG